MVTDICCADHLRRKGPENGKNYNMILIIIQKMSRAEILHFFIFFSIFAVRPQILILEFSPALRTHMSHSTDNFLTSAII